ncbi:hypothetical protein BDN72DRAFT_759038 [Pluteus cervinus]|uniref:Uncharacterized protein n=1 Tax=Pluteus cervinus TaxID=181527 RepID=A0ACD3B9X7_9AGAR|nr:hypothetical protein BDN72DRAFT_759038 [Pluteus cervinus]
MATQLLVEYPELSYLSRQDLEDILSDPVYFQAIFHSLERVKALYQSQAELGRANESIASHNLTMQESLYALRSDTKNAFDEARSLESRWKDVEKDQREIYSRYTPQFLLMRLKHSITAQDDASEAIATAFVQQSSNNGGSGGGTPESGMDIDDFVKEFRYLRRVYHKRVIWGDKWSKGQVSWREG